MTNTIFEYEEYIKNDNS